MKTNIRFSETEELLDIRHDRIFKAVFTKDSPAAKGALSDLISTLIERKVVVSSITANEPPIDDIRDRSIRFDISCKTETSELVNIEMSFRPASCELARLEYYTSKLFSRQDIQGIKKSYSNLKDTYQIAILANGLFFDDEELVHRFHYHDPKNNVSLGGKTKIIIVELIKTERLIEKPINEMATSEAWALFFQYLTNNRKREKINEILSREAGIAMASEVLIEITQEDIEWARQLSEEKYINDYNMMIYDAEQEGMQKGMQKGLQKGRLEGRLEVAKNLKARGVAVDIIAGSTGLSLEEIALLA